jgi:hypothetical protein
MRSFHHQLQSPYESAFLNTHVGTGFSRHVRAEARTHMLGGHFLLMPIWTSQPKIRLHPANAFSLINFLFAGDPLRIGAKTALFAPEHFCGFLAAHQLPI